MEAASRSRRVRLEELKRRKEASQSAAGVNGYNKVKQPAGTIEFEDDEEGEDTARIRTWSTAKLIRSFRVRDARLKVDYNHLKDTIERDVAGIQEGVLAADEVKRKEELDLTNIAPKKPNWDLKRDMDKRLAKLSRRDREARLILIRQRIAATTKGGGVGVGAEEAALAAEGAEQEDSESDGGEDE